MFGKQYNFAKQKLRKYDNLYPLLVVYTVGETQA